MLTVNGLCYCASHRMEICGACGYDFRIMNRMRQLQDGDDVHDRAVKLDRDEAARNEAPLRAPVKDSVKPPPPPSTPVLNSKARAPRGLDPSALPAWLKVKQDSSGKGPLELAFQGAFSMREMF